MSVYRDVTVSREDVDHFLEIAGFLRLLSAACDGEGPYGCWADDLWVIARRYERAGELEQARGEVLDFNGRGRLRVIEGGNVA